MSNYIWNLAEPDLELSLENDHKIKKVQDITNQYILSDDAIRVIQKCFQTEIDLGLTKHCKVIPQGSSTLSMKVTFLTEYFNGKETGDFVILDLHTHHLLLVLAKVRPGFPVQTVRKYFVVDEKVRREPYIMIFEFICNCLLKFFTENNLLGKKQTVGFCTNLPTIQFGLEKSTVCYFTSSAFEFPLNEYDVNRCFEIVLNKEIYKDVIFDLVATMSDNTSTFFQLCYRVGKVDALLNLVNDCDIVYYERIEKVEKWKCMQSGIEEVLIDTELRNFGGDGSLDFIATDSDWTVLSEPLSNTRASQLTRLEKFISERYLQELIRCILVGMNHDLLYCKGAELGKLYNVAGFFLDDICNIANSKDINHASRLLPGGSFGGSEDDAKIACYVCKIVLIRAALLTSICLAGILSRYDKDDFVIAVKSCLIQKHPTFEMYIRNFMTELAPGKKFQFFSANDEDVCHEGAALVTAIANRLNRTALHF